MKQAKRILIAEDEEADIMLLKIILEEHGRGEEAFFVRDGQEALEYLFCRGKYESGECSVPSLVLLDLKLPKVTGLEILKLIRTEERLKKIPVVIFTSSTDPKDRAESLAQGASHYVVKPFRFEEFKSSITAIVEKFA